MRVRSRPAYRKRAAATIAPIGPIATGHASPRLPIGPIQKPTRIPIAAPASVCLMALPSGTCRRNSHVKLGPNIAPMVAPTLAAAGHKTVESSTLLSPSRTPPRIVTAPIARSAPATAPVIARPTVTMRMRFNLRIYQLQSVRDSLTRQVLQRCGRTKGHPDHNTSAATSAATGVRWRPRLHGPSRALPAGGPATLRRRPTRCREASTQAART